MNSQVILKQHASVAAASEDNADFNKDEYFNDLFEEECLLLEGLDPEDIISDTASANEELWDILDISDSQWGGQDVNEFNLI